MDIVDLSCPLSPATSAYPGDPEVTVTRMRTHAADGYEVARICLGSHSGTHLDAPRHFFPRAATLDEYPVSRLVGPGVIVDARPHERGPGKSDLDGPRFVEPALLSARLRRAEPTPGCFILLWTEGAYLSPEAGSLLLNFGPSLVGTDGPSLDPPPATSAYRSTEARSHPERPETYPVHRLLLGNDVLIAEELRNLNLLGSGPVTCAFLPLAILGTDGAPIRAIAWR